jgi:hypothetical protein
MKVINNVGFGLNFESNCTFGETSQVSLLLGRQEAFKKSNTQIISSPGTPDIDAGQTQVPPPEISTSSSDMKSESTAGHGDGDGNEVDEDHSTSPKEG